MDPFILTRFSQDPEAGDSDPLVSLVIFEWNDEDLIGKSISGDPEVGLLHWIVFSEKGSAFSKSANRNGCAQEIETICDESSVEANLCTKEELGSFILAANATDVSKSPIISKTIHLSNPVAVNYPVKKTGFYCVSTYGYSGRDYTAMVEFRNAYGELPAAQIAKLPFYGALTLVYAVIGMYVGNS